MERKQSLNFDTKPWSPSATRSIARVPLAAAVLACAILAGCTGTPKQAYPETFSDTNTFSRAYSSSDEAACEAARRALLSQGYTISKAQTDGVEGQKNFQVEEDKHQVISFHVVCASDHHATPSTTVFVNAVQDRYIIKKTSSSAGVGLSVLGSVSMPFSSSDDSLSKISSQTISDSAFYNGFFDLLQRYLPDSKRTGLQSRTAPDAKAPAAGSASSPSTPASSPPTPASSPSAPSTPSSSPAGTSAPSPSPASSAAAPAASPSAPASPPPSSPSPSPAEPATPPSPGAPAP